MNVRAIKAASIQPRRPTPSVREREILRIAGLLLGTDAPDAAKTARNAVLSWAKNKSAQPLPPSAWSHQSFELLSGGRSQVAVRLITDDGADFWAIRIEDPDKTVPGRIWTTEIVVEYKDQRQSKLTARLLVGSHETTLDIEPHVPGVIRQIINKPGLSSGPFKVIDKPLKVTSPGQAESLATALVNDSRTLPIIVLTVPEGATDAFEPLLDAQTLAQACAGMATVIILPAALTWKLTERFGKRLSVYEGAARIYLPGFKEDDNPFGGHELFLPQLFATPPQARRAMTRLRWLAANASVRRLQLGRDVPAFAALRLKSLEDRQAALRDVGADALEQLAAARDVIKNLEEQVKEAERYQKYFSDQHDEAERRAEAAESVARGTEFRIKQLTEQLQNLNIKPDENIAAPLSWGEFGDWCDKNLAGRITLTPEARRSIKDPEFKDVSQVGRCLLWLANEYLDDRVNGGEGTLRDKVLEPGVRNSPCGVDAFEIKWQGKWRTVDWHIKNGGNVRDPARCLRVYYFWDDQSQQVIVADLPAHRRTTAT